MKWQEVLDLPIGTKVRLPWWGEGAYIFFQREQDGELLMYDEEGRYDIANTDYLQDTWELAREEFKCSVCGNFKKVGSFTHKFVSEKDYVCGICKYAAPYVPSITCQDHPNCKITSEKCEHLEVDLFKNFESEPYIFRKVCTRCEIYIPLTTEEKERWKKKREYMNGSLALNKLLSGEFSKIILDDVEWIEKHGYLRLIAPWFLENRYNVFYRLIAEIIGSENLKRDWWYGIK